MTIPELASLCKEKLSGELFLPVLIVLVGISSFSLGRLSAEVPGAGGGGVTIEYAPLASEEPARAMGEGIVASKSGEAYYDPACAGASRISEANKVWFTSRQAAEAAGYRPAANCFSN